MDNTDRYISGLWAEAKKEAPHRSFAETQTSFSEVISDGGMSSWISSIINLNSIIMTSIVIVTAGLIWSFWPTSGPIEGQERQLSPVIEHTELAETNQGTLILTEPIELVREQEQTALSYQEPSINEAQMKAIELREDEKQGLKVDHVDRPDRYIKESGQWEHGGTPERSSTLQEEKEQLFTITNNTTREELEHMRSLARAAGIDLNYKTKGNIKKINLTMTLDTEHGLSQTSLTLDGKFEMKIGWWEDEHGQAIRFSSGDGENDYRIFQAGDEPLFEMHEAPDPPETPHEPELLELEMVEAPEPALEGLEPVPPIAPLDETMDELPELEEGQKRMIIHIDRSTSGADLKGYQGQAERAGLELDVPNFKPNGRTLKVKLRGPDSQMTIRTEVDTREDVMEVKLGWVEDADGDFVRFLERAEIDLIE